MTRDAAASPERAPAGDRGWHERWREALTGVTPIVVLGALTCCALPIALVAAGAGTALAALLSAAPWLVAVSRHKEWVFAAAALLLLANYWALYRSGRACEPGGVCHPSHPLGRWLRRVFWASTTLYAVALLAAYLSLPIVELLGG